MKRLLRQTFLAAGFLLGALCSAAVPPPAQLFPKDTVLLATVPNWTAARAGFEQAAYGRLWADPAMRPFREKVESALVEQLMGDLEKDTGIKVADYLPLLQGQVTVALIPRPAGASPVASAERALVLLVDSGDKAEVLKQRLGEARQKLTEAKKALKSERIRDVEFTTVVLDPKEMKANSKARSKERASKAAAAAKDAPKAPADGAGKDKDKEKDKDADDDDDDGDADDATAGGEPRKIELSFGQVGSALLVTDTLKALEPLVAVMTGGSAPLLAENEDYQTSVTAGGLRDANAYAWVNFASVFRTIEAGADKIKPQANAIGVDPRKALAALGLQGMKSLAVSARQTPEGEFAAFTLGVPEAVRTGLFKLIAVEPKDSGPPSFVPADAVKFQRWRVDGPKTWAALEAMLQQVSPQLGGFLQMSMAALGKDRDPNFDFRKSFIANLGNDLISYEKAPKGRTLAELADPPSLTLVGSGNADQLVAGFRAAAGLLPTGAEEPKVREFNGRKVYGVKLPAGMAGSSESVLEFAASSGFVAMGSHPATLEEFLRSAEGTGKSLRDLPGLADAAGRVGGMSQGLFGYEDSREVARAKWEAFRQGDLAKMMPVGTGPAQVRSVKEWVDFTLLPPFDEVSKYFSLTVYAGSWDAQGFSVKAFSPGVK